MRGFYAEFLRLDQEYVVAVFFCIYFHVFLCIYFLIWGRNYALADLWHC